MTRTITALATALLVATSASAFAATNAAPSTKADTTKSVASLPAATHQMPARRVEEIQAALQSKGENLSVDGIWGAHTTAAMRDFQKKDGLRQTGRYDQATAHKLSLPRWS